MLCVLCCFSSSLLLIFLDCRVALLLAMTLLRLCEPLFSCHREPKVWRSRVFKLPGSRVVAGMTCLLFPVFASLSFPCLCERVRSTMRSNLCFHHSRSLFRHSVLDLESRELSSSFLGLGISRPESFSCLCKSLTRTLD